MSNLSIVNKVNILLYHQVGNKPNANTNLDCFCKVSEFYLQMKFLYNSDFEVISLTKALDIILNKRKIDKNYVTLTFDDGCERFYDLTFPILENFNFSATIYPVAGYLGQYATWSFKNNPELKILSKSMLIELNKLGVEIGAHTLNHKKLTQIKHIDAIHQVRGSKEILEQLLGEEIFSFAYPHGDFNYETIKIVQTAGFISAMTCINSYGEQAKSAFEIPRKYITYNDDINSFMNMLN